MKKTILITLLSTFLFVEFGHSQILTKLTIQDAVMGDNRGSSVAISDSFFVVGAPQDTSNGQSGAAYVFRLEDEQKSSGIPLMVSDADSVDEFGHSVAISGDFIVVGVPKTNAAYVFKFDQGSWQADTTLIGDDISTDDEFGYSVAISGDFIVVGAPGADSAYVFELNGGQWQQDTTLTADSTAAGADFGFSVAIKGDFIAVGAPESNTVYVFELDRSWQPVTSISDPTIGDKLGWAVDISRDGEFVVIGEPFRKENGDVSGAAYIYNGLTGLKQLAPDENSAGDNYGWSVAISGNFIIIGAPLQDSRPGFDHGAAFKFIFRQNEWNFVEKLIPDEMLAPRNRFGWAVAIADSSDDGIIGAPREDEDGAVFVIDLNKAPEVDKPIKDIRYFTVGDPDFVVNLDTVFADLDTLESLSYTATSLDPNIATADTSGSRLTVSLANPVTGDSVTIIATATDIEKESAKDSFTVFVNFPPFAENVLADTTLRLGCFESFKTALTEVFGDSDDVTLNFSIEGNSDSTVASASISEDSLSVSANDTGSTIITIKADDNRGGQDSTSFTVSVNQNQAPKIENQISEIVFSTKCGEFTRDLFADSVAFSDPEGDSLSISVKSLDEAIATAAISGNMLTVSRESETDGDTTTIVLTAVDVCGADTSMTISVRIDNNNQPPVVVKAIPDTILTIGQSFTRDLDGVFEDRDGDQLTYTASSSKPAVVEITQKSILKVTLLDPREGDVATITIGAKDASACPTDTSFTVSVNFPPEIAQTTANTALKDSPFEVNFTVTDDRGLAAVTFSYREGGKQFVPVPIQIIDPMNSSHLVMIPGNSVSSRGIEYRITAIDKDSASIDILRAVQVRIPEPGVVDLNPPAGTKQADYRLFSVPLEIVNSNAQAVLEDDLGSYNKEKWRFFALKRNNFDFQPEGYPPERTYDEFEEIRSANIDAGKAFWLLINDENLTIDTGEGISYLSNAPFEIPLNRGWNFIGNPFDFEIPIDNICLMSGGKPQLFTYAGTWGRVSAENAVLNRFEGFAIENPADSLDTIIIDPSISPGTGPQAGQQVHETPAESINWSIQISAHRLNTRDIDNYARVSTVAASEHDPMDWPEPPVIGDYVSVYFSHKEWQRFRGNYTIDTRPEPTDGLVWDFEIKTQNPDKVDLSFDGLEEVPQQFEIWLIDEVLNISQNLRENKTYSVAVLGQGRPRSLKLIVGNQDFTDEKVPADQILPTSFELTQNFPNPFNPATTIRYSLPKLEKITLRVYNLLGEEVATLVQNEEKAAGHHFAIWDGRNQTGQPVSSGLYLYRLQAGEITIIKKMALVK